MFPVARENLPTTAALEYVLALLQIALALLMAFRLQRAAVRYYDSRAVLPSVFAVELCQSDV